MPKLEAVMELRDGNCSEKKTAKRNPMIVCRNFLRYDNEKKERQRSFSVKEGYYLIGEVSKITGIPKGHAAFLQQNGTSCPRLCG